MFTTSTIIALGTAVLSILYGLLLYRNVIKQPEGSKKIIDAVNVLYSEVKAALGKQNSALFAITAATFVIILYLLNWETAIGFAVGVLSTILINIILANMIAKNSGRVLESARKGLQTSANMAFKSGAAGALISCGLGLLIVAAYYAIFKDTENLIGLGLGVSLVALFGKLTGKLSKEFMADTNRLNGLFELSIVSTIITMFLGQKVFDGSDNSVLFPLVLTSASVIAFAVASILIRFFKNTKKFSTILYSALGIEVVLFGTAVYFSYHLMMKSTGVSAMVNVYGLAIISLIILFLGGLTILFNIYGQVAGNANKIAEKSETPIDVKNHLAKMTVFENLFSNISKFYYIWATALISVLLFYGYTKNVLGSISLNLGNYLVLSGLLIGLVAASLFYFQKIKYNNENINKAILLCVILILLPVIIGLTLGASALGGYVIGVILIGLFASVFFSESYTNIIRISAIIALLIASSIVK